MVLIIFKVIRGLQLTEVEYRFHSVQIDNDNNFRAALFSFSFDQGLFFPPSSFFSFSFSYYYILICNFFRSNYTYAFVVIIILDIYFLSTNENDTERYHQGSWPTTTLDASDYCFPPLSCVPPLSLATNLASTTFSPLFSCPLLSLSFSMPLPLSLLHLPFLFSSSLHTSLSFQI